MVNVDDWVLPTSTTSGVSSSLASAVVSRSTRPSHSCSYGFSVDSKMSVRFERLPSFAIANNATNEFPARARPS